MYRENYGVPIIGRLLVERVGNYVHAHTLYSSYRPLGTALFISTCDDGEFGLWQVMNNGEVFKYFGCSLGKGKPSTSTDIEKGNFRELTVEQALPLVAKMVCKAHSEARENSYEFEASWISAQTDFKHAIVPNELRKTLVVAAEKEIEEE